MCDSTNSPALYIAAAAPFVSVGAINLGVAANLDSLNVETVVLRGDRVALSKLDAVDTLIGFNVLGLSLKRPVFFVSTTIGLRIKPFFKK